MRWWFPALCSLKLLESKSSNVFDMRELSQFGDHRVSLLQSFGLRLCILSPLLGQLIISYWEVLDGSGIYFHVHGIATNCLTIPGATHIPSNHSCPGTTT